MRNTKGIHKLLWVIAFLLIIPSSSFGNETNKSKEEQKPEFSFVLTIKDSLISLKAKDAPLKEIVEDIGSRMGIKVISKIPVEQKVTLQIEKLPLETVIERLREYADMAYIRDSEKKESKITKILLFLKGKGETLSTETEIKEEEEEELAEPELGEEEVVEVEEEVPQTEAGDEESAEEEVSEPEPFKFEFDPSQYEGEE
ncbi:MAG: hypothetical protein HYW01_09265 [Deltaproteobacteria bacterium]|nr:hypothetical protein [Deltaproteobacteria bacterium]